MKLDLTEEQAEVLREVLSEWVDDNDDVTLANSLEKDVESILITWGQRDLINEILDKLAERR